MRVEACGERALWDAYVEGAPGASNYHRWGWKQVIENAFGWPTIRPAAPNDVAAMERLHLAALDGSEPA